MLPRACCRHLRPRNLDGTHVRTADYRQRLFLDRRAETHSSDAAICGLPGGRKPADERVRMWLPLPTELPGVRC